MNIAEQKKALRAELRAKLSAISAVQREEESARACAVLQSQTVWQNARSVFFYSPLPSELNIWALVPEALKAGKTVLLPRFDPETQTYCAARIEDIETDLLPGRFGINEPAQACSAHPLNRLDLTLVPGVGFDSVGRRLGRGRGFYDRLLAEVSGTKCGVAFDEQMTNAVPVEPHDIRLNCILTPSRWIALGAPVCE